MHNSCHEGKGYFKAYTYPNAGLTSIVIIYLILILIKDTMSLTFKKKVHW